MNNPIETSFNKLKDTIVSRNSEKFESILKDAYISGWHEGRHYDRDKWSKCEYLIIDPSRIQEIEEKLKDYPCKNCASATEDLKIGCYTGKTVCQKFQNYLFLQELVYHFSKKD